MSIWPKPGEDDYSFIGAFAGLGVVIGVIAVSYLLHLATP